MKLLERPYEETITWFKKITRSSRRNIRKPDDLIDGFDVFEYYAKTYIGYFIVLVAAFALETLMLPVMVGRSAWISWRRRRN